MEDDHVEHERLVESLNDDTTLAAYADSFDTYHVSIIPRLIGGLLIWCGNVVYGRRPSYQKFRAIEVIARVPYHSWTSALFTLLTLFYTDERRALQLSTLSRFTRFAAENETMHVVVISMLACSHERTGFIRHSLVPVLFAFFYFWLSYLIYLLAPRWSLEINYLFEDHAFVQYSLFLEENRNDLAHCTIESEYLAWYGRHPRTEYEFFRSVRNDELIHRNRSVHEIALHERHPRA